MELASWNIDVISVVVGGTHTEFNDRRKKLIAGDNLVGNELYGAMIKVQAAHEAARSPVSEATEGILSAALDSYPLTRYYVAKNANVLWPILGAIPDVVRDRLIGKAFSKRPASGKKAE